MLYKANIHDSDLEPPIQYVRSFKEYQKILEFRHVEYNKHLKQVTGKPDVYDCRAHLLYTKDMQGNIDSMMRLVIDSEIGLPDDNLFGTHTQSLRDRNYKLMELGRFHILNNSQAYLKAYYASVMNIATAEAADIIIMAMQHRHIKFHEKLIGVEVIDPLLAGDFGSGLPYAAVAWEIQQTKPSFFDWLKKA